MARYIAYEETYRSNPHQLTKSDAEVVLACIREGHPASSGWEELEAYVEQAPNGKWRAVRVHRQWKDA